MVSAAAVADVVAVMKMFMPSTALIATEQRKNPSANAETSLKRTE
jgi:hypothetical protein